MNTARVLLCKRTGNLLLGYRVSLFDKGIRYDSEWGHRVSLDVYEHDGWIVSNESVSPFKWFMNREWVDKEFIDLGSLEGDISVDEEMSNFMEALKTKPLRNTDNV